MKLQQNLIKETKYTNVDYTLGIPSFLSPISEDEITETMPGDWSPIIIKKIKRKYDLINVGGFTVFKISPGLHQSIQKEIDRSIEILNLEENWDGYGGKTYKRETYINAVEFIVKYIEWIWEEKNTCISTPKLFAGKNGSIDVIWRTHSNYLFVNIPEDPEEIASYFGKEFNGTDKHQGQFNYKESKVGIFLDLLKFA